MSAREYIVAGPLAVRADRLYRPGEAVALSEEDAEALLEGGVIQAPEDAAKARKAAILAAYSGLHLDEPEQATAEGKAKVEALEAVLGFDITAAERDEAHAALQG